MGGIVLTSFGNNVYAEGYGLDIQSDGKIIVGGELNRSDPDGSDFFLQRFTANGSVDTTFGGDDGHIVLDMHEFDVGVNVTSLSNDKFLFSGYTGDSDNAGKHYDFFVARYNADGNLDKTFSTDGRAVTSIGDEDRARAVGVQSDGKIVLGGVSDNNFALVRYNTDGTLDSSFSADGKVTTNLGGEDIGRSMAIQSDGKILLAGVSGGESGNFAVVRYNTNGTLDTSFSADGKLITNMGGDDIGYALTLQSDGKILLAGTSNDHFAIARYNANGSLDSSFGGGDGKVVTSLELTATARSIVMLDGGKFLVGGFGFGAGSGFTIARYNANGALDKTFSGDGIAHTNIFDSDSYGFRMLVQDDGKILLSGTNESFGEGYLALLRYNANGSLDSTFGPRSGTRGSDVLDGTSKADVLQGLEGDDTLNGLEGDDRLDGGDGNDLLRGSSGNDMLAGGTGADHFRFGSALNANNNVDTIKDFSISSNDVIQLENAIFKKLAVGELSAGNFRANGSGTAVDGNDYILYNTTDGKLYYDADGDGSGAKMLFAVVGINNHADLTNADFAVV